MLSKNEEAMHGRKMPMPKMRGQAQIYRLSKNEQAKHKWTG